HHPAGRSWPRREHRTPAAAPRAERRRGRVRRTAGWRLPVRVWRGADPPGVLSPPHGRGVDCDGDRPPAGGGGVKGRKATRESSSSGAVWAPDDDEGKDDGGDDRDEDEGNHAMVALAERELLDDLSVGELATYYDDGHPEDLLVWAFDRF